MAAEYIAVADENQAARVAHHVELIIPGDIESVRAELVAATTQLGYLVVEEEPIIARFTKARYSSISIVDYIDTLTIRLKPLNPTSVRVIFEYKYADVYGKKARAVLTRQAEAIVAIANASTQNAACPTCGTETTDGSRFCRKCGATTFAVPAEVDLLDVVANSHAGYLLVLQGTAGLFLAFATLIAVIAIKGPAEAIAALVFALIFAVPSFVMMIFGIRRLGRTVIPRQPNNPGLPPRAVDPSGASLKADELPVLPAASVTEGTTELLIIPKKRTTDKLESS